jgi:hypothetical protein
MHAVPMPYGTPGVVLQHGLAVHLRQFDNLWDTLVDYLLSEKICEMSC